MNDQAADALSSCSVGAVATSPGTTSVWSDLTRPCLHVVPHPVQRPSPTEAGAFPTVVPKRISTLNVEHVGQRYIGSRVPAHGDIQTQGGRRDRQSTKRNRAGSSRLASTAATKRRPRAPSITRWS